MSDLYHGRVANFKEMMADLKDPRDALPLQSQAFKVLLHRRPPLLILGQQKEALLLELLKKVDSKRRS